LYKSLERNKQNRATCSLLGTDCSHDVFEYFSAYVREQLRTERRSVPEM